jgi:branched-subunit amino acid ABC-type transport system permease component
MTWLNAIVQGVLLGGLYALLASGLSLMFGVMRVVNLAHGALAVAAAYLALSTVQATGLSPLLALVVVVPVMAAVGFGLQLAVIDRALAVGPLAPLLATFGLAVVLESVLLEGYSADTQSLSVPASRRRACASRTGCHWARCRCSSSARACWRSPGSSCSCTAHRRDDACAPSARTARPPG